MQSENSILRINSIDIVRLFSAFLVIAKHTEPFKYMNLVVWNFFYKICVLAVPYFFVISGYFMGISKNKVQILKQYIKCYVIWSVVYDTWMLLDWAFLGAQYGKHDFGTFMKYRVIEFFGWGSFYHMWFLWALIFLTGIIIIFEKMRLEKLLLIPMIGCFIAGLIFVTYYGLVVEPNSALKEFSSTFLNKWWFDRYSDALFKGFPYFYLGYWLSKWKIAKKYKMKIWFVAAMFLLYLGEQFIISQYGIARSVGLTLFMYVLVAAIVLWLLQHPLHAYRNLARFSKESANYIYFVHALVIEILIRIYGENETMVHFIWTIIICMVLALFRYWMQDKKRIRV